MLLLRSELRDLPRKAKKAHGVKILCTKGAMLDIPLVRFERLVHQHDHGGILTAGSIFPEVTDPDQTLAVIGIEFQINR